MKIFWKYLKDFIKEDFHLLSYLYVALFLLAAFFVNYRFDFEDNYIDKVPDPYGIPAYLAFYLVAWFGAAIPVLLLRKEYELLRKKEFWILGFLFLFILSFDAGFYHHRKWVKLLVTSSDERVFLRKIFVNLFSISWYTLAFFVVRKLFLKAFPTKAFGLLEPTKDWKSYLGLWMLMLPLLVWASFQADFLEQYPEYKPWKFTMLFGESPWVFSPVYELCYALDFVAVEWMFRGALGIAMARILGRHALLPMVCCYAFLHFGKPFAEALGSIFGGYILGVIAIRSGSIWGGCLVHVGIALTMDALALTHKLNE